jgi:hypothetical protein
MTTKASAESFKTARIKNAALRYGKAGFKIYPSPRKDGAAYVKWKDASTSDPATIEKWWTQWPDALICLDCGKSEIGVIDVDTLEGHNVDGQKALLDVEMENGFLPLTRMAQSPSKGVHYFFRDPGSLLKTTSGKLGPGLDTRGRGGMVVLEPSIIRGKGAYRWLNNEEMASIPQWVLDVVGEPSNLGPVPDAEFEPVYTDEEFKTLLNLLNVDDFREHDKWLSLMLACTHSSTVNDGKEAFMDWTTGKGEGEFAGDWDIISDRWDYNFGQNRNKAGRAFRVGTFNKFLRDAGFGDRVENEPPTSASDDFAGDTPDAAPLRATKLDPKTKEFVAAEEADPAKIRRDKAQRRKMKSFLETLKDYTLCTSPVSFIASNSTDLISKATFSARYNPSTASMQVPTRYKDDAAKYVISLPYGKIERVDGLCYRPGDEQRIVDGKANMWVKPAIEPLDEKPTILLGHVEYLIPDEVERKLVLDWMAHCVQKPMVKLMFALLIVDDKGRTGKSYLGYLMRALLGEQNVLMVGEDDKIGEKFNAERLNKCFTFIHEVMPEGKVNIIRSLRSAITEDGVWIEKKGVDKFLAENRNNIMAASNFIRAVKMMQDEGRWAVARGATDIRFCDDEGFATDKSVAYYNKLFVSIGMGPDPTVEGFGLEARRALNFFMKRDLSSFNGQSAAPKTKAKSEIAEVTQGNWASFLNEKKADKAAPFTRELFTAQEVLDVLAERFTTADKADARTPALSDALMECGCRKIEKQGRVGEKKTRFWTLSPGMAQKYNAMSPQEVADCYVKMREAEPEPNASDPNEFDDEPMATSPVEAERGPVDAGSRPMGQGLEDIL